MVLKSQNWMVAPATVQWCEFYNYWSKYLLYRLVWFRFSMINMFSIKKITGTEVLTEKKRNLWLKTVICLHQKIYGQQQTHKHYIKLSIDKLTWIILVLMPCPISTPQCVNNTEPSKYTFNKAPAWWYQYKKLQWQMM